MSVPTPLQKMTSEPWWQNGYVWLLLAGPVLVIIASFLTLYLAVARPDPVVDPDYYNKGLHINQTLRQQNAFAPAVQARNHAATGVPVKPQP